MAEWKKVVVSGSQAELNSLTLDTALTVPNGGTGATTLTDGGVLLGSGTGAITALPRLTAGQVVVGSTTGDPVNATLTEGANITITEGDGTITIAATGLGSGTVQSVSGSGNVNGITLTSDLDSVNPELTLGGTLTGVDLTSQITGILPVANGGTNASSFADKAVIVSQDSGTDTLAAKVMTTNGSLLIGGTSGPEVATLTQGAGITITNADGSITIAADNNGDITEIALATNGGLVGSTLTGPIPQLSASLDNFSAAAIDVANDSFAFIDANDGNRSKKESIADLATAQAGTGITAASGQFSVDYGTSAGTAAQGNVGVTFNGTANEVELTTNTFTTIGGGGTVTIGLPDDVVIGNDLTVSGDLTVFGTASFQNTENLLVADRFLLLASGSNTAGDGGIVVQQDTQDVGELFGFDSATNRWAVTSSFSADASAYTPDAFMATALVGSGTDPNAVASRYDAKGNIFVGTDEEIWIYA